MALAVGALAVPSASLAASPSESEYDTTNHQIAAAGGSGGPSEGSGPSGGGGGTNSADNAVIGGLPFTGFDVGVLALASLALLGSGLTLRRLSDPARRSSS